MLKTRCARKVQDRVSSPRDVTEAAALVWRWQAATWSSMTVAIRFTFAAAGRECSAVRIFPSLPVREGTVPPQPFRPTNSVAQISPHGPFLTVPPNVRWPDVPDFWGQSPIWVTCPRLKLSPEMSPILTLNGGGGKLRADSSYYGSQLSWRADVIRKHQMQQQHARQTSVLVAALQSYFPWRHTAKKSWDRRPR